MNYKRNHRRGMLLLLLPVLLLWSCKEDNPTNPDNGNEQELITTVTLSLTENGTSNVV
ncbi:hypothetical protein HUU40_24335, partial [candidate division KSB1 bacterium]|nr:hypothetical protein [candidate division KSB1 bacterium]